MSHEALGYAFFKKKKLLWLSQKPFMKSEAQTRRGRSTGPQSETHKLVISLCAHVDGGQKITGAVVSQVPSFCGPQGTQWARELVSKSQGSTCLQLPGAEL